jgi:hydroxymethylpyrimidine/phosphomethylpyrimidine kinase
MNETVALSIAGYDPSGGAGITADLKTFAAFGCYGTAAITSLTFQNTVAVYGAANQSGATVRAQVIPILEDFEVKGVKTGMLPSLEVIETVADIFRKAKIGNAVIDPVVRSSSGFDLIDDTALSALVDKLLPLGRVVTPNIPEAERITGLRIRDKEGMVEAAARIRSLGAQAVLVKGGHMTAAVKSAERSAEDLLDDGGSLRWFSSEWIETNSTHGTGCTLSAAIAACLGKGVELDQAVEISKRYVTEAIRTAPALGHGHGPLNHRVAVRLDTL